jgi:hypothetical protein
MAGAKRTEKPTRRTDKWRTEMRNAPCTDQASQAHTHADRHAYNAAFEELGLTWHWDAQTYDRLQAAARGRDSVRAYLETEQSHLLRAYEADFLVNAIEAAKARCRAEMGAVRSHAAPRPSWSAQTLLAA